MNLMKRAAQLRRKSGNRMTVQQSVKKAAAEARSKKRGRKKVGATLMIEKRETKRTKPKRVFRVKRSSGGQYAGSARVAGMSVSSLKSRAKHILLEEIGELEAKKFSARLKRDKSKIAKRISEKKAEYRKMA